MPAQIYLLLSFSISFAVVFLAIPKVILVSNAKKLFDIPNHRSASQKKIIPNLGGIAIFSGFYISAIISLNGFDINKIAGLLLSTLVMFLMGLKDDTIGLSAKKKLIGQVIVTLYLVIVCNIRITNLHGILGINEINYSSSLFISILAIIGLINAFNLIDGIDGLAAGIGTIISVAYGFLFLYFGQLEYAIISFSVAGGLIAFFFYNVFGKANKIFMGDTGSLTLGVIFAVLTIWFNEMIPVNNALNPIWSSPAISLAIMIVPVIDSVRIFSIRIYEKRSPFSPDMKHIHHQLIKFTNNHLQASLIMMLGNLIFICLSIGFITLLGNNILFFIILTTGFSVAYIPVLINKKKIKNLRYETISVSEEHDIFHLHRIKTMNYLDDYENEIVDQEKNKNTVVVSENTQSKSEKLYSN